MVEFSFKCKDIGMTCGFETKASTKEELLPMIAEHAKNAHNITEMPPEIMEKVENAIKKSLL